MRHHPLIRAVRQVKKCKDFASVVSLVWVIKTLIYYYFFRNRFFNISTYSLDKKTLVIARSSGDGFFACCGFRIIAIGQFFNKYKKLPEYIDSTCQFQSYKLNNEKYIDVVHNFFKETNINIQYTHPVNFGVRYKILSFEDIKLFMEKYFQPSTKVMKIIKNIEKNIN